MGIITELSHEKVFRPHDEARVLSAFKPAETVVRMMFGSIPESLRRDGRHGSFAHIEILELFGEHHGRLAAGVKPQVHFRRGEVDEIPVLPIGGHRPGHALLRLRQGGSEDVAHLPQTGLNGFILYGDVCVGVFGFTQ